MVNPTLTITLHRDSLSLSPLVFYGHEGAGALGVTGYQEPASSSDIAYMPDSRDVHGSEAIASRWQQSILGWDWFLEGAANEAEVQAMRTAVRTALGQFSYFVDTQISGAPIERWSCDPGSQQLKAGQRSYEDLRGVNPIYAVTIPVHPIPGAP